MGAILIAAACALMLSGCLSADLGGMGLAW